MSEKPEPIDGSYPVGNAAEDFLKQKTRTPKLPDSFFDGDLRAIQRGRIDLMQHDLEQLQKKVAELEFCLGQHNQLLEWLRAKVTKLLWFVPTEEIDPVVEANGSGRYPNGWTKVTGMKLWRAIGRKGK